MTIAVEMGKNLSKRFLLTILPTLKEPPIALRIKAFTQESASAVSPIFKILAGSLCPDNNE